LFWKFKLGLFDDPYVDPNEAEKIVGSEKNRKPALQAACRAIGECPPGHAVVTEGFDLPARFIIHTVGPVWRGGVAGEPEILASCYRSSLAAADAVGADSVAFPAISTGVYGYPPELAAEVAVTTVGTADCAVSLVRFVAFDDATHGLYLARL